MAPFLRLTIWLKDRIVFCRRYNVCNMVDKAMMHNQEEQSRVEAIDSLAAGQAAPARAQEKPVLRDFGRKKISGYFTDVTPKMSKTMAVISGLGIVGVGAAIAWPLLNAPKAPDMEVVLTDEKANPAEKAAKIDVAKLDVRTLQEPQTLDEAKFQIQLLKNKVAYMDLRLSDANKSLQEKLVATEGVLNAANAAEISGATASAPAVAQPASSPNPAPQEAPEPSSPLAPPPRQSGGGQQGPETGSASDQPPPKPAKKRVAKPVAKPKVQEDHIRVAVLDINPDRVVVVDESRPDIRIRVSPGAELPGGATFIGFDPQTRLMKTDQGEFHIP